LIDFGVSTLRKAGEEKFSARVPQSMRKINMCVAPNREGGNLIFQFQI